MKKIKKNNFMLFTIIMICIILFNLYFSTSYNSIEHFDNSENDVSDNDVSNNDVSDNDSNIFFQISKSDVINVINDNPEEFPNFVKQGRKIRIICYN